MMRNMENAGQLAPPILVICKFPSNKPVTREVTTFSKYGK